MKTNISEIKIEKNIPIAKVFNGGGKVALMRKLNIGDSIKLPKLDAPTWRSCAHQAKIKVKILSTSETECRLWRIK